MTSRENFDDNHGVPIESNDDALLRMLGGAIFAPGAKMTLPSGKELVGDEAQVFVSAFDDQERTEAKRYESTLINDNETVAREPSIEDGDNPLDSRFDNWGDDQIADLALLVQRAKMAVEMNENKPTRKKSIQSEDNGNKPLQQPTAQRPHKKHWWKRNRS